MLFVDEGAVVVKSGEARKPALVGGTRLVRGNSCKDCSTTSEGRTGGTRRRAFDGLPQAAGVDVRTACATRDATPELVMGVSLAGGTPRGDSSKMSASSAGRGLRRAVASPVLPVDGEVADIHTW